MNELTEDIKRKINEMSQSEMASLWRFAPVGHPFFVIGSVSDYFKKKFKEKGGMTPEISKAIGW